MRETSETPTGFNTESDLSNPRREPNHASTVRFELVVGYPDYFATPLLMRDGVGEYLFVPKEIEKRESFEIVVQGQVYSIVQDCDPTSRARHVEVSDARGSLGRAVFRSGTWLMIYG